MKLAMPKTNLNYGSQALSHVEPYLPEIAKNHEMAGHFGRLISNLDYPKFVAVEAASHMRDNDYVISLVYKGVARAYPLWIIDHYHVINDIIAEEAVVVVSCDACQSGAAFIASLEGRRIKFAVVGIYNATFLMIDRQGMFQKKGSLWLHYEGLCIFGDSRGTFSPQIPTFHMTWKEWRTAHPDTEVMSVPEDRYHRDLRHGHGRGEYFARPGLNLTFIPTLTGALDGRYPENEMVLGINADEGIKAYPLREVMKNGGVVQDTLGDHPLAVFAGPLPGQFTMAAYSCFVDDKILSFRREGFYFVDNETKTEWTIEGRAIRGPLAGRELTPLRWCYLRWHAWFYSHRGSELYRFQGKLPSYPQNGNHLELSTFKPVLDGLLKVGRPIRIEGEIVKVGLPHEAERGLCLWVGSDRLNLYHFTNCAAAEDYVVLQGAWFCVPDGEKKAGRKFSCRRADFVLESDPEIQYADPAQIVRLPDLQIRWSDLVRDARQIRVWSADIVERAESSEVVLSDLLQYLEAHGYDIVEAAFLPHGQLRIGTVNVITATIRAERFIIYKCKDKSTAERVLSELSHSFRVDRFIFRATPVDMYGDPPGELAHRPDEEIRWGKLVDNGRFITMVRSYIESPELLNKEKT